MNDGSGKRFRRPSQTKIVATVGPACESESMLAELIQAGVDVFRLNTAHGDQSQQQARLEAIRRVSRRLGQPVAVLVDLAGPKIRLGELPGGQRQLTAGQTVRFVRAHPQGPDDLVTTYEPLVDELSPGDRVMLADGTVSLVVESTGPGFAACRVVQPGLVRSRQGVNLPGVKLSAPALGPSDRHFAQWAAQNQVDFLGLSFVRSADEVRELKALLAQWGGPTQVIAKIEKPEALECLEAILDAADGVMVARGDLGVEIDIAQVAVVQKRIVALCARRHKPVIIATQMLDSMQHATLPTRAEVADVANAILDGADACMLSGETAIGQYPRQAVEMMHRIALATESVYPLPHAAEKPDWATAGVHAITEDPARGRLAGQRGERPTGGGGHGLRPHGPGPLQESHPGAHRGRQRFGSHPAPHVPLLGRHPLARRPHRRPRRLDPAHHPLGQSPRSSRGRRSSGGAGRHRPGHDRPQHGRGAPSGLTSKSIQSESTRGMGAD